MRDAERTSRVLALLLVASLTGLATTFGAVPFLFLGAVPRRHYDAMLGFGAGLMLAAATLGLLPEALHGVRDADGINGWRLAVVLVGFAIGVAVLFVMDRAIPHRHAQGHDTHDLHARPDHDDHPDSDHANAAEKARHQGLLVLGAMTLHRLPEGFAIGAGFAAGQRPVLGIVLAAAVAAQNAVEGAVMAAPLRQGGLASARMILAVAATGFAVPLGAVCGYLLSAHAPGTLPAGLSVGAGAVIYLACNEIIPESHSHGNERRATFGLLLGFVFIILLEVLLGSVP